MDNNIITGLAYNQLIYAVYPSYELNYANKRNMPMLDNTVQLYKNINQKILLEVRSLSHQLLKFTDIDFYMNIINLYTNELVLRKIASPLDISKGRLQFDFLANDLDSLEDGKYSFSISVYDVNGIETVLYVDQNGGCVGSAFISSGAYPSFVPSANIHIFYPHNINNQNYFVSQSVPAAGQTSNNDGLNTIAIYTTAFSGELFIQGSIEQNPGENDWFFIPFNNTTQSMVFTNSTGLTGISFESMAQIIRFLYIPDPLNTGTISQILSRSSFKPQR